MKSWIRGLLLLGIVGLALPVRAENSFGLGAQIYQTTDSLPKPFEENGLAPVISYRLDLAEPLKLQVEGVYYADEGYAGSRKESFAPQAFLLFGGDLYAGLGLGMLISDGEWSDAPFYALRAGYTIRMFPALHLDLYANYEFANWDGINELDEDLDSDTIGLGAALRFLL